MSEKIVCGGLIEKGGNCLVEVLGFAHAVNEPCAILGRFGAAGIPLAHLSVGNGADGINPRTVCSSVSSISVVVDRHDREEAVVCLRERF